MAERKIIQRGVQNQTVVFLLIFSEPISKHNLGFEMNFGGAGLVEKLY